MNISHNRRFNQFRKLLGLTQKEVASRLSISQGSVTDIERCRIGVSNKILEKLETELDLNKSWLYTGDGLPFLSKINNDKYVKIQGENTGFDAGIATNDAISNSINKGIEISNRIGKNNDVVFSGYYEDNKIAYYLRHSNTRLDGLLSVAISDLKNIYNSLRKLTAFILNVGAPDFIIERFTPLEDFETYKNENDNDFEETYSHIKDAKVLKCTRLVKYEEEIDHFKNAIVNMIDYIDRYDDFFTGHQKYLSNK